MNRVVRGLTLGVALAVLGACASPGPRPSAVARLQATGPSPWRQDFGDPVLADLLARADKGAMDIKSALARLERADADVEAARGARSLAVAVGADAATGYAVHDDVHSGHRSGAVPSLSVTYEADLFKRLSDAQAAAQAQQRAGQADVAAARLLIGAETARTYVALRLAQAAERRSLAEQVAAERALALTRIKTEDGRADGAALSDRLQAASEAEGRLSDARLDLRLQQLRLAALTGDERTATDAPLPAPTPLTAVASDAVARRPDVMAAYHRLAAADAQRAMAVAAERPRFEIALSFGAVDPGVLNLLDARSLAWAAAATVSHTILDGGGTAARIKIASSDADLAELAYRKTSLQGWTDIRSCLAQASAADDDVARSGAAAERAREALRIGNLRHGEGLIDGVPIAELQGRMARAERGADEAKAHALSARIALALAVGG